MKLGFQTTGRNKVSGCKLFTDENTPIEIRDDYWAYIKHLKNFTDKIREYRAPPCSGFNITDWIPPEYLSWHSEFGYAEPLLPVLRHPAYCESQNRQNRFRLDYILHDFDRFCSHTQSRSTRKVFVDMGASPIFHGGKPPAIKLLETYEQFGVHFDHIYAYEMTKLDPEAVFNALPPRFISNYHWINVAVDVNEGSDRNPFTMLMNSFTKDDFVVLKIDIDHGESETELFRQLLASEQLQELVDVFYFEHHVHLYELAGFWGASMKGSVYDSLAMFSRLRHAGIASHHWI